jgi:hypothetical protein
VALQPRPETFRYWAPSRLVYARALVALVEHARASSDDYTFGPLELAELARHGLVVSGPHMASVAQVLREVTGLVPEPD